MKGQCWVSHVAEARVMNWPPECSDSSCREQHSSSPWASHGAAQGSWAGAVSHWLWWMWELWHCLLWQTKQNTKNYLKDKASRLAQCWPLWAETRAGRAPCVASSEGICCHTACPWGFLPFSRSVPSDCHTAAPGYRLASCSSPWLSCRGDFCHYWGQCLSASRFSCTSESFLSHLSSCQEEPVFSQGIQQPSWLIQRDQLKRWDISVHLFPAKFPRY